MNKTGSIFVWAVVGLLGTLAISVVALRRGEPINALWLVVAAACCYALGYRFYSKFIAAKILALDASRATPDRKSTRLNSSHANISYAVFCLKKKKKTA